MVSGYHKRNVRVTKSWPHRLGASPPYRCPVYFISSNGIKPSQAINKTSHNQRHRPIPRHASFQGLMFPSLTTPSVCVLIAVHRLHAGHTGRRQ